MRMRIEHRYLIEFDGRQLCQFFKQSPPREEREREKEP